ncbi:probable histone-lysine N-methyltransferase, H3 lysine-36 and H4 lysine-20 specific isoform at N-terminal half [Coccomyxa sp. Obi]|nr:probable histone-lysine N-methyltransferase, H3 lysine-36 and H4 lysine-20 specific isoform at N-terminal half [Coccomyxa sp. Obi]
MEIDEGRPIGSPAASGPEGDVCRPTADNDAAQVAAAAPKDDDMAASLGIREVQNTADPAVGKDSAPAAGSQHLENGSAVQMALHPEVAGQAEQQGMQSNEAEQAEPSTAEQPLEVAIGNQDFIKAADAQRVVWARVKGFPHWPAQILTEKEAAVRLENVFRPSPSSVPVMFFGTMEIAWMAPAEVVPWTDGVKANYLKKNKNRRHFLKSVEQAHEFLAPGPKRRKAPEGWWKKAINPPKPKPKETVLEIGAPATATQAEKPGTVKGAAKGADRVANGLGVHIDSKVAKRVQRPVKRIDGADEDELKELLGDEGEVDLMAAPKRRGSAGRRPENSAPRPPHYIQLQRNLWTCRQRPKRLPKDDVPVCGCTPPMPAAPVIRPSTAAAPPIAPPPPPDHPTANGTPADAAGPSNAAMLPAAAGPGTPGNAEGQPPAQEGVDVPMTILHTQPMENGAAVSAAAVQEVAPLPQVEVAAEAHAPIAVPGPSAMSVPPAAVAHAAKAAMPERTGCGENCLNRLSYIHCDPKQCPCGEYCSNRPFHALPMPKTELFLTENRGWGVKAAEHIPRGTFIVEYAGEVIEEQECRRRMAQAKETGLQHFYMMELAPGLIIDARNKGNMARFINSSCAPNCESQKWHDAATGEIRIGIFAAQDIEPGTELAYDYQFQHAGLAQDAGAYRCMCGAPNCRGTMDTQPERFKDFGKRLEVFWDGDSVFYRGTVTAYSTTTGKHTILYDDNDVERVDLKTVKHRWLDENAPLRMSPLHAALVAQNGLLGPEFLDLNDGAEPVKPLRASPVKFQLEAPAPAPSSLPSAQEEAAPAAAVPATSAEEPAHVATVVPAAATAASVREPAHAAPELHAAKRGKPSPVLEAEPTPLRTASGRKRKQTEKAREQDQLAELEEDESEDALVPKTKMLLKRCQREKRGKQSPALQAAAAGSLPAGMWPHLDPAAAAQLTANAGAPPLAAPQLAPPFNAPPFAAPPFPLSAMPPGLPGQNALQAAMYQMLLMNNPQLMQAHKALGGAVPPQLPMASMQQMFATFANTAAAAPAPSAMPWPAGGVRPVAQGAQLLPPLAPLQLGPLTPAAAAPGPGQPPLQSMTPNFWGVVPPGHVPQVPPPMWPHLNSGPGSGPAPAFQPPIAHAAASVSVLAQQPVGVAMRAGGAAYTLGDGAAASAPSAQGSAPAAWSGPHSVQPRAVARDTGEAASLAAAVPPVAGEQQALMGSTAPQEAIQAEQPPPANAQQPDSAHPAHVAAAAAAGPATQELQSAAAETRAGNAQQSSKPEEAMTGTNIVENAPAAPAPEQPNAGSEQEPAHAVSGVSGQAMSTAIEDSAAADTGSAARSGEQEATPTTAARSEAPAVAGSAAAATEPQCGVAAPPADKAEQPDLDTQSKLAADAGAALIGVVREEATGGPGEGHSEQHQSQLAADAGAALVGNIRAAAGSEEAREQASPLPAEVPAQHSQPQGTGAALPSGRWQGSGGPAPDANGSSAEQLGNRLTADITPQPEKPTSQRLFDPTAVLSNGFVSPSSDAIAPPLKGLVDPMRSAAPRPGVPAVVPPSLPVAAQDVEADVDEAELWGSLLVDSPSPCKTAKVVWTQDASLWRPNGSGPAPPSLGQ